MVGDFCYPFWKIKNIVLVLENKALNVSIFGLNVLFKFSESLGEKKSQMFPCRASFYCVFEAMYIQVSCFHETFTVLKNFWLRAW